MIRALLNYLRARFRMIGRCPPHRYEKDGREYPFCVDCGERRGYIPLNPDDCNAGFSGFANCTLPKGHEGHHGFGHEQ